MRIRPFPLLGVCLLAIGLPARASAQERITSYHSDITVNKDATMTVTETITVNAQNVDIKHGIYRDFPTVYKDTSGVMYRVGFQVVSVGMDGAPEQYRTQSVWNGERVYIGNPNSYVSVGRHTYTITYWANRELGFFADHDELYWNVTGNGWKFPIDKASAVVTLPGGIRASSIKVEGYTGPKGSKATDLKAWVKPDGKPAYVTTKPLAPYEGLTIVAAWPKGIVAAPTQQMRTQCFLQDNAGTLIGALGLIVVLGYFVWAQRKVGIDPRAGAIVPQWDPPDGLSPAAVRYVSNMGPDNKALTAALINAAVKGCLTISKERSVYAITRAPGDTSKLAAEEHVALNSLLHSRETIKLSNSNASVFQTAISRFNKSMDSQFGKTFFSKHLGYAAVGAVMSLVALVATFALGAKGETAMLTVFMTIWTAVACALLMAAVSAWRAVRGGRSVLRAGCTTLFALPFLGAWLLIGGAFLKSASVALLAVVVLFPIINLVFLILLRAYTPKGRAVLDKIEGLKMYMEAAERERLDAMNPPDKTPELFEKLLPYAIALGVEQRWSEQFADVLAKAQEDGYRPGWYDGAFVAGGIAGFASSMGSSISGAISSASTPPGSSSGSGGGGSSGGGGGGGGGGGW